MESDGPWWAIIVIAVGATVVLGAILVSAIAVAALGTGRVRRRLGRHPDRGAERMARHWSAPLLINVLLGIPGVVPIWLLWYLAVNGPLAELGLTVREPTENDGMLLWLLIVVPVVGVFGLLWWLANGPLRRRTALAPSAYWPLSVAALFIPTAALILNSWR